MTCPRCRNVRDLILRTGVKAHTCELCGTGHYCTNTATTGPAHSMRPSGKDPDCLEVAAFRLAGGGTAGLAAALDAREQRFREARENRNTKIDVA